MYFQSGIKSNATQSVRSPICNLSEENPRITVDGLQTAIGWEFLRTPAFKMADGGPELISKQRGFQFVNPNDNWFPGESKKMFLLLNFKNEAFSIAYYMKRSRIFLFVVDCISQILIFNNLYTCM